MGLPLCISCKPEDLDQGLFGMVLYYPFQILPYLLERNIFPAWEVRTKHYGDPPDFMTIPGAVDLAYVPPEGPYKVVSLHEFRRRHTQALGNNWAELHRIWSLYFAIPPRISKRAEEIRPKGRVLGIHYRGTDKQTTAWDSNPITQDQYLTLIQEFLSERSDFDVIFAATDEFSFVEKLRSWSSLPVVALGEVEFHLSEQHTMSRAEKTDRAMLDCVLLSQCDCVIETSSALPSFTKIFNPDLEIYRCAASKVFSNMPYFPVAYIPVLPVKSDRSAEILRSTMHLDWTHDPKMQKFKQTFAFSPRWPRNHRLFRMTDKFGASDLVARVFSGYR